MRDAAGSGIDTGTDLKSANSQISDFQEEALNQTIQALEKKGYGIFFC